MARTKPATPAKPQAQPQTPTDETQQMPPEQPSEESLAATVPAADPPPDPPAADPEQPDLSQSGIGVGTQAAEEEAPPDTPPTQPRPESTGWDTKVDVETMEGLYPKAARTQIPAHLETDVFLGQTLRLNWHDPADNKLIVTTQVNHETKVFSPDEYSMMLLSMLQEPSDKDYYQQALNNGYRATVVVLSALRAQAGGTSGQPSGAELEAHAESVKHLPQMQQPNALAPQQPNQLAASNKSMCSYCGTIYVPARTNQMACSNVCAYLLTGHPVYENLAMEKVRLRQARIEMGELDPNVYPAPPPVIGPRGPTVNPDERWAADPRRVASHQVQTGPGLPPAHLPAKWTGQPLPEEYQDRSSGYGGDVAGAGMHAGSPDFTNPGQPGYPHQQPMQQAYPQALPQGYPQQPQQFQRQPAPAAPYIPGQDAGGMMQPAGGYQPMVDGRTPNGQPWQGQGR